MDIQFSIRVAHLVFILVFFFFPAPRVRAEWSLGAFIGKSFTHRGDLEIDQPAQGTDLTFSDIHYADESFRSPIYYGARIGYFFESHPHLGVELEFFHFKVFSDPDEPVTTSGTWRGSPIQQTQALGDIVQRFSISHGVNFLLINLVGRYGLFQSPGASAHRVQLLGRFGIGPAILHPESTLGGVPEEHYELNRPGVQLAIGSSIPLGSRISLLAEYKFTYNKVADAEIDEGTATTSLFTHHLIGGVEVHF